MASYSVNERRVAHARELIDEQRLSADAGRAAAVARAFGLGGGACFTGRLERGEQGQVEELVTARGAFAVKTSFGPPELDGEDTGFQAAAREAGGRRPR